MEPVSIFLIATAAIAVVTGVTKYFSKDAIVKRKLKSKPKVSIRDFNHGEIGKVVGEALIYERTLVAPLSGRECLYYQILVQQKKDDHWTTILNDEKKVDFLVKDGIGIALVKGKHVKGHLIKDLKMKSGTGRNASNNIERYLRSKGKTSKGFLGFNKTIRYYEGVIEPHEMVTVKGKGEWEAIPDPTEQKLIMTGNPEMELYVSDDRNTF